MEGKTWIPEGFHAGIGGNTTECKRSLKGGTEFGKGGWADLQRRGGRIRWAIWVVTDTRNPYAPTWASPFSNAKVAGDWDDGAESVDEALLLVEENRESLGLEWI